MSDLRGQSLTAPATWRLASPPHAPGAVSLIELRGDLDEVFRRCSLSLVAVGEVRLRRVMGIDDALIARWSDSFATLMPHGGIAVTRLICDALTACGVEPDSSEPDPRSRCPEASTLIEARMLEALTRAASPLAVDLLLAQPDRWKAAGRDDLAWLDASQDERDRALQRLIDPPLVAAIGPPNVGKSTLVNALARRGVSVVADQPGTTRDHVGVLLDLEGLVIRYMDAPGIRETTDPIEAAAIDAAIRASLGADLILELVDASSNFTLPEPLRHLPRLRVRTRFDLHPGPLAGPEPEIRLESMHLTPDVNLVALTRRIRESLVPASMLESPEPWRWE